MAWRVGFWENWYNAPLFWMNSNMMDMELTLANSAPMLMSCLALSRLSSFCLVADSCLICTFSRFIFSSLLSAIGLKEGLIKWGKTKYL